MDQHIDSIKILADPERNEKHKKFLNQRPLKPYGVKRILPAIKYHFELSRLFLWRAIQNDYFTFTLATEMEVAEKFYDVVLQYKQNKNDIFKLRLVQVKHIQSAKSISLIDLLSKTDQNNFSLQKYFKSYLKIKQQCTEKSIYSIFFDNQIEDLLICTNSDLEPFAKSNNCSEKLNLEEDKILNLNGELKAKYPNAAIYMFKNIKNKVLVETIKAIFSETSDFCKLINELVDCCIQNQLETNKDPSKSKTNTHLLNYYYYPLTRHVFNIVERFCSENKYCAKFLTEFIDGEDSSVEIQQFRNALFEELNKKFKNDNNKNILGSVQLRFPKKLLQVFKPETNPQIENMNNFVAKIKSIIDQSDQSGNKVINISDNDSKFMENVHKFAGYILITKYNKIHFSTSFLDGANLPGNLDEFRASLKELLGDEKFCSLYEYDIEINDKRFKTCEEGALDRKLPSLPGDTEVEEFFSKFKIVINYPNSDDIHNVIEKEMKGYLKKFNVIENIRFYMEKLSEGFTDRKATLQRVENTNAPFNEINRNIIIPQKIEKKYKQDILNLDYQLHLLILILWRAIQNQYFSFRLGTDLKEAGHFDDVVFQYKQNKDDNLKLRLVQVKYIQNTENKNISEQDFLSINDRDNFSLQKYFHSYHKIKKELSEKSIYSELFGSEIVDLIICTNMDLEPRIKLNNCFEKLDLEEDKILKLNKVIKEKYPNAAIYMIKNIENKDIVKKINKKLSETSDFWKLINEITDTILQRKPLEKTYILDYYYYALTTHVFCRPKKENIGYCARFLPRIIRNSDSTYEIREFRNALVKKLIENSENDFYLMNEFQISEHIAEIFVPEKSPQIKGIPTFSTEIKDNLEKCDDKTIKIISSTNEFEANVRQLAGYVLVTKYDKIHFSTSFLDGDNLPGNLNEFRAYLKALLGDEKFVSLYEYDIQITDTTFKTCEEGALDRKLPILPGDTEMEEFFSKFKVVVNYPNAVDIVNVIGEDMKVLYKKLNVDENKTLHVEKLYNWLKDNPAQLWTEKNITTFFDLTY